MPKAPSAAFLLIAVLGACPLLAQNLGKAPGFDAKALDASVDPCVDFYQYACGVWMKENPIPPDQSRWGRFSELTERNREQLHQILERASADDQARDPVTRLIGDYYFSCMDEKTADSLASRPLQPELDRIDRIRTSLQLIEAVAHLHEIGVNALFNFGPSADLHDSRQMIATLDQGGLGLPDRDHYLKDDAKSVELRGQYVEHVTRMFRLLGEEPKRAATSAEAVLAVETALAGASMDRTLRRDPKNRDHKTSLAALRAEAPGFAFERYFALTGAPAFSELNVVSPYFFKQVSEKLAKLPLPSWKAYLRWQLVHGHAALLSAPFVVEGFRFYEGILTGQKEQQPRFKRCVRLTDADLGEALGRPYVEATFGEDGKERMLRMVHGLEQAMGQDIKDLPWMTEATKQRALEKLAAIGNNIGYPDHWRDYGSLRVVRGDLVGNAQRANEFETRRQLGKIGRAVDRFEWTMSPPTVNAYASPQRTTINFPAGILQPPFFDKAMDDPVNYGGIGVVIGHELTHLFDDQGRKFDKDGNLSDWWSAADAEEFEKRVSCIADEYSQFVAVSDVKLNGRLTLGENTGDNGGIRIAYLALLDALAGGTERKIDGFTPAQRFFLGYAQIWCENRTDEVARLMAQTNPHSPGRYRVNGVVSNSPEFQQAFACSAGQPMVREPICRAW